MFITLKILVSKVLLLDFNLTARICIPRIKLPNPRFIARRTGAGFARGGVGRGFTAHAQVQFHFYIILWGLILSIAR